MVKTKTRVSSFPTRLKELREERRLSQRELADAVGMSNATIAHWETGRYIPKLDENLFNLANYFNVTLDYIVGYDE